jgi:SAM-dependent methyltransferase
MNDSDRTNSYDSELLKYYGARAPEYEQIYYRDAPQRQMELAADAERLQRLVKDRSVLDLACGTGYWLEKMSATAHHITASDISSEMIDQARQKEFGCPVDFVRADMNNLPLGLDTFDLITLGFWFSHHPRQHYGALYSILRSYMKDSGSIWMIDNNPPAEGLSQNSCGTDESGNNLIKRRLDSGEEYTIIKNYFDRDQLVALLSTEFKIERLTYGIFYWSVVLEW